nr:zinc finger, GRF-type [Tanacetum cinerariifolium]
MVFCWCRRVAIIKTSWTDAHPGHCFNNYPITGSQCSWIDWVDPPMCARAVQIIPGLLRVRNMHEAAIQELTTWRKCNCKGHLFCLLVCMILVNE